LFNSTLDQAETAALPGDFKIAQNPVYSDIYPAGIIFDQKPAPATLADKGSTITVTISLGPQYVAIPDLSGQPVAQAQGILENDGLTVTVVEQGSKTVPSGDVIGTDPTGQVKNGSKVSLYASVGDKVQVPDVFSTPRDQALSELENAGLTVGTASPQSCSQIQAEDASFDCTSFPDGDIVSGTLQWNSWVPRGATINVAYYDASLK
jgi:serine/threonine-protein kinase